MVARQEWLGWAAGFIDGEGSILLSRRSDRGGKECRVVVNAVNTDIRALHRLKEMFGGSIHALHSAESIKANARNWKPSWMWTVGNQMAEDMINALLPHLLLKRDRADLALASRKLVHRKHKGMTQAMSPENRDGIYTKVAELRLLNKRGA